MCVLHNVDQIAHSHALIYGRNPARKGGLTVIDHSREITMAETDTNPPTSTNEEPENGFLKMSHAADEMQEQDDSRPARSSRSREEDEEHHSGDLMQMVCDEISARPLQAVAWAATAGLALGLFVAARAMAPRFPNIPFRMPR